MARDLARRAQQSVEQQQANGKDLRQQLMKMEAQFQRAMPRGSEAVQLIRDVMTCMSQTPKLALCDAPSVLGAAMTCAQLGLRPGVGALGHAWILPFWDDKAGGQRAQLIIGYKGYVELGHRSDRIASLHSRIVYTNDRFSVKYGAAEDEWIHEPCLEGERGDARLFYAVGRLANGGYSLTDPMTVADMEKHRDRFAMARNRQGKIVGPWVDHFESMAQKTMLLRLMALMPKSTDIQRAMDNDGSVRMDLSEGAIDTPTHIDGEVIDEADAAADVVYASTEQIAQINAALAKTVGDDLAAQQDWLSAWKQEPVDSPADLTADDAVRLLAELESEAQK